MPWVNKTESEIKEYNRIEMRKWRATRTSEQLSKVREYDRNKRKDEKLIVIEHYSHGTNMCADVFHMHLLNDPFLSDIRVLTIDHIKGNGSEHRKELGNSSSRFYRWLIKNNFPEGYQILCIGCQWIKRFVNKELTQPQL